MTKFDTEKAVRMAVGNEAHYLGRCHPHELLQHVKQRNTR